MNEIVVQSSSRSYQVSFESLENAWSRIEGEALVVTDRNVHVHYGPLIRREMPVIVIEPGESSKSMDSYSSLLGGFADNGLGRSGVVVALGGGVVGDLAGFAAATYMRGVACVQIPTSLLAMVDSSVGGKVGIDLPQGKNLVGAFHQPQSVSICLECLATLPERHWRNGLAEIWKYAFIGNPEMESSIRGVDPKDPLGIGALVRTCIEAKARVCEQDEFDRLGLRATLNFGHTVGHAIEAALNYEELLHGEAVAIGMVAETRIAERMGFASQGLSDHIASCLAASGLPVAHPILNRTEMLLEYMKLDKKSSAKGIGMSLVADLGECKLFENVPTSAIAFVLDSA